MIVDYDTEAWPWQRLWQEVAETSEPVSAWHGERDQNTVFHAMFYESFGHVFSDLYRRFVAEVAGPAVMAGRPYYFQKVPTFRACLPGCRSVLEFHTDAEYGHQDAEVNCWLPFGNAWGSNSIYLGSVPQTVDYGQMLVFDGVHLFHGSRPNRTGVTRFSIDFRLIAKEDYHDTAERSVAAGVPLGLGDYFCDFGEVTPLTPDDQATSQRRPLGATR